MPPKRDITITGKRGETNKHREKKQREKEVDVNILKTHDIFQPVERGSLNRELRRRKLMVASIIFLFVRVLKIFFP